VTFPGGDVEVVDLVLNPNADGVTVGEFEVPDGLRIAAVRRRSRTIIPHSDFKLKGGDLVVAAARHGVRNRVIKYLIDVEPTLS
jgi:Trk K+ transport system NAD-binding subunit